MSTCDRLFLAGEFDSMHSTCERVLVTAESMAIAMHDGCALTGARHEVAECPNAAKTLHYADHIVKRLARAG